MHANAFGLSLKVDKIDDFIAKTDEKLKDIEVEPLYYVDFIYSGDHINGEEILEIGSAGQDLWGQDVDEPFVAVEKLKVKKSQVTIYSKKDDTIKISTNCGVDIMKFKATAAEVALFNENEIVTITLVGRCNANQWGGKTTPQIFIEEFQVDNKLKYDF